MSVYSTDRPVLFILGRRREEKRMSDNRCHRCLKGLSRRIPCFVAWTLLLVLSAVYFIFICPSISNEFSYVVPIVQGLIFLTVVNNLLLATFTDPGRYSRAPSDETDDSETTFHKTGKQIHVSSVDGTTTSVSFSVEIHGTQCRMKWCQTCGFYRPPRCSHCSVCDFCIDVSRTNTERRQSKIDRCSSSCSPDI